MEIYAKIQRYLRVTGMPPCVFGRRAVNDPRLVGDLRRGREPRAATRRRIEDFIAAHPDAYVPRPRGRERGFCLRAR